MTREIKIVKSEGEQEVDMILYLDGKWLNSHGFGEKITGCTVTTSAFTPTGERERCTGCGGMGMRLMAKKHVLLPDGKQHVATIERYTCRCGEKSIPAAGEVSIHILNAK